METIRKPKRGRPSVDEDADTISGGNTFTGESLAWSNGHWAGTARFRREAEFWCRRRELMPVPRTGAFVEADQSDPLAVYAVIAYVVGEPLRIEYRSNHLSALLDEVEALARAADFDDLIEEVA